MKKLIMLLMGLFLVVSCSSKQVEKAKISGAKMLGNGVTVFMDKVYKKKLPPSEYTSMACSVESTVMGNDVKLFIEKKLGVNQGFMSLSVGGEIAKVACGRIAQELVPSVIGKNIKKYPCFAKLASGEAGAFIEKELCNSIEF